MQSEYDNSRVKKAAIGMITFMALAGVALAAPTFKSDGGGWQSISSAPRDGTLIEVKNVWGIMPTYSLNRFSRVAVSWWCSKNIEHGTSASLAGPDTKCPKPYRLEKSESPQPDGIWENVAPAEVIGSYFGPHDTEKFFWRPYHGTVKGYIDPTGGKQFKPEYWR